MSDTVLGKYQLFGTIGQGTFGEVKKAKNLETGQEIAIKFERCSESSRKLLFNESETLSHLQGGVGIPKLFAFGKLEEGDYMVTELLGDNLLTTFKACGKVFSAETVAKVAVQIIERLEFVHDRGFLHRDMKPENLLLGHQCKDLVYLTDFGLAKKYVNCEFGMHIPFKKEKSFVGTLTYASLNMHMGLQQSRRDDLQSCFFVLLYFLKGKVPWQSAQSTGRSLMKKLLLSPQELFEGCPQQFELAVTYVRSLQFEERPDYGYLKGLFAQWTKQSAPLDWLNPMRRKQRKRAHTAAASSHPRASEREDFATFDATESPGLLLSTRRNLITTALAQPRKTVTFSVNVSTESDHEDEEDTIKGGKLPTIDREKLHAKLKSLVR